MQIVYLTGAPRCYAFAITEDAATLPPGAIVLARSTEAHTIEYLDEHLFKTMTDEEFYTFRELTERAARRARRRASTRGPINFLRRFWRAFLRLVVSFVNKTVLTLGTTSPTNSRAISRRFR